MKKFRTLLLTLVGALALSFGVFALAACGNKGGSGGGSDIGDEYKAVYEYYKQAAGSSADSLEDWYAEITADMAAADSSEVSEITVIEFNSVRNVKVTFANDKIYLQPLVGGDDFREYAMFVLNAKNAEGNAVSQVSLNICSLNNGEYQVLQTVRTNVRGTADAYCEMASAGTTYYVQVADASSATYGIAHGYEPALSVVSGKSTVEVTVGTPIQYEISVNDNNTVKASDYSGMEVSLRYTETAKQGFVVASGTTDAQGELTLTFTPHEGSTYEIVVKEGTQPEGYEDVEPVAVDLTAKASVLQLFVTRKDATPQAVTYSSVIEQMPGVPNREVEAIEIGDELGSLVKGEDNLYTYNGEPVYVALGYQLDRVYKGKTIAEVIEANDTKDYYWYEERTDEATNTWTKYLFHDMLAAYVAKADNNGLYRLNEDLYKFIEKAQANHLFAAAADTDDELELLLPLVKYGKSWLMADAPEIDVTASAVIDWNTNNSEKNGDIEQNSVTAVPVDDTAAGYYKLTLKDIELNGTYSSYTYSNFTYYGYTSDSYIIKNTEACPNEHYRHYFFLTRKEENNLYEGYVYIPEGCKELILAIAPPTSGEEVANLIDGATFKLQLTQVDTENKDWASLSPVVMRVDDNMEASNEQEYEVVAIPATWQKVANTVNFTGGQSGYTANYTTFGVLIAPERGYETYTISAIETTGVTNLQVNIFNLYMGDSYYKGGKILNPYNPPRYDASNISINNVETSIYGEDKLTAYAYGFVFTHAGDTPVKIRIKFTATWSGYRVHYSAGDGVGEDYIDGELYKSGYNSKAYVLDPTVRALKYKKEGYSFIGWKYEDKEGAEHTVQPGDFLNFLSSEEGFIDYNVFLEAQWRENTPNVEESELGLGESGKLEATLDGSQYSETEVKLSSAVTEGYYKLTVDLGGTAQNRLTLIAGSIVSALTPAATSSDTNHIYITYFHVGADPKSIYFPTPTSDFASVTANLTLEKIDELTLNDNKEETKEIPVNSWYSDSEGAIYKATLGDGIVAGSYYIKVERIEGYEITICTESVTLELGNDTECYIDIPEGDEHIWLVGSSERFAQNILANISIHRVYTITFETGGDSTVTGTVPKQYCEGDTDIEIRSETYKRTNYQFKAWVYDDGETKTEYKSGATFHMPKNDIVFTAKWQPTVKLSVSVTTTGVDALIDPEAYTGVELSLSDSSGRTGATFRFDNGQKNSFLFFAELGDTEYDGALDFQYNSNNILHFMYSDVLSTPTNKVYAAYFVPSQQGTLGKFTLQNFDAFEGYSIHARLSWVVAAHASDDFSNTNGYLRATYTYSGNSTIQSGSMDTRYAPTGVDGSAFALLPNAYYTFFNKALIRNTLNTKMLSGGEYTLHIKTNGFKVQGLKNVLNSGLTFTADEDGYEWTADVTTGAENNNYYLLTYTSLRLDGKDSDEVLGTTTPAYIADAWLEAKDAGNALSEETPVTVRVSQSSPATIKMGSSVLRNVDYILKATFKGDKKGDLSVVGGASASLSDTDNYTKKRIQFTESTITLSTESAEELEVTLTLTKFAPLDITNEQAEQENNRYELPDGNQELDLQPSSAMKTGAATTAYKVWLDLSEVDETSRDSVVVKLKAGKTYEFNKTNDWTLENITLTGDYYEIWSEGGSAVVTVFMEKLVRISGYNTWTSYFDMTPDSNEHDIWLNGIPTDGNNMYKLSFSVNKSTSMVVDETMFTLIYDGDKQATFTFTSIVSGQYECGAIFLPQVADTQKFVLKHRFGIYQPEG